MLDVGGESAGTDGRSGVQYIRKKEVGPISGSGPGTCKSVLGELHPSAPIEDVASCGFTGFFSS